MSFGRESWFLHYRENANENGEIVRKQKCIWLAAYSDRYGIKGDLDELVADKLAVNLTIIQSTRVHYQLTERAFTMKILQLNQPR